LGSRHASKLHIKELSAEKRQFEVERIDAEAHYGFPNVCLKLLKYIAISTAFQSIQKRRITKIFVVANNPGLQNASNPLHRQFSDL
jgi:hypothetical protein